MTTAPDDGSLPVTIIEPSSRWAMPSGGELWRHRELLWFLILRNVRVRYAQTFLGAAWAVLQPLVTAGLFALFFGRLASIPSEGIPFHIFALAGMVPWTYFATAVNQGSQSLVNDAALVTKVYVPRLLLPMSHVASGVLDLGVGIVVLLVAAVTANAFDFGVDLLFLPVAALAAVMVCLSVVCGLAALNVRYRDVRHTLPFMLQVWLFLTPLAYPADLVEGGWRTVYALNPMVGVVELFRIAVLPVEADMLLVLPGLGVALLTGLGGAVYFRRVDATFADVV